MRENQVYACLVFGGLKFDGASIRKLNFSQSLLWEVLPVVPSTDSRRAPQYKVLVKCLQIKGQIDMFYSK